MWMNFKQVADVTEELAYAFRVRAAVVMNLLLNHFLYAKVPVTTLLQHAYFSE